MTMKDSIKDDIFKTNFYSTYDEDRLEQDWKDFFLLSCFFKMNVVVISDTCSYFFVHGNKIGTLLLIYPFPW